MKEKIKHWLTHNILLKLVALVLAILTWMAFYSGEAEITDLNRILEELERISMTVEAIQLWCEKVKLLKVENN